MGYSSHLVLKTLESSSTGSKTRELADIALKLHYSQYGLNLVWSGLFFGGRLVRCCCFLIRKREKKVGRLN